MREGPAGTLGTPIRAPKQKYLPPKKAGFPWPLSKRGKTSNSLSKLPNEYLFSQPTSLLARGHVLASWDPWDSHQIPRSTFNTIHPWNKPIFLGRFQRGERPLILSQNSQMNHFSSAHLTPGEGSCISQLGPRGPSSETPNNYIFPLEQTIFPEPLSKRVKTCDSLSKLQNRPFFFHNQPHSWQGAKYWPAGTPGTPIRAPKQLYLPPKQAGFPWPLRK